MVGVASTRDAKHRDLRLSQVGLLLVQLRADGAVQHCLGQLAVRVGDSDQVHRRRHPSAQRPGRDHQAAELADDPVEPGDLIFFGGGPSDVTHVGIYVGNGQMVDAPHTGADVRVEATPTTPGASWGTDVVVGVTDPAA